MQLIVKYNHSNAVVFQLTQPQLMILKYITLQLINTLLNTRHVQTLIAQTSLVLTKLQWKRLLKAVQIIPQCRHVLCFIYLKYIILSMLMVINNNCLLMNTSNFLTTFTFYYLVYNFHFIPTLIPFIKFPHLVKGLLPSFNTKSINPFVGYFLC